MHEQTLEHIGLTSEEAKIYLSLLEHGPLSASQLAKNTKIQRTYIYQLTKPLIQRGLVSQNRDGKSTLFVPLSPDYLLQIAQAKDLELSQATAALEQILPGLRQQFISVENKPLVRVLEGVDGLKKTHLEVLSEEKEILAYVLIDQKLDKPLEDFWPKYYQIRKEKGIRVRSITPDNPDGKAYQAQDADQLRQTKLIPAEQFPVTIEKNIVGNKVIFFSREEDRLIATIIDNKAIADTEKALFELHWKMIA